MFLVDLDTIGTDKISKGIDGKWYEVYEWGGSLLSPINIDEVVARNMNTLNDFLNKNINNLGPGPSSPCECELEEEQQ